MIKSFTRVCAAAAILVGASTAANAFVVISITDSAGGSATCDTTTCVSGSGFTVNSSNNVSFSGTVGNYFVDFTTNGISNTPGNAANSNLKNNSSSITANTVAANETLTVNVYSYDFTQPAGTVRTFIGSASLTSGTGSGSVQTDFYANSNNTTATSGLGVITDQCIQNVGLNNSCNTSPPLQFLTSGPFSLRDIQTFSLTSGSNVSTTSQLTITVPEPTSLALVGLALVGAGVASRRRKA